MASIMDHYSLEVSAIWLIPFFVTAITTPSEPFNRLRVVGLIRGPIRINGPVGGAVTAVTKKPASKKKNLEVKTCNHFTQMYKSVKW